jgi:cytochrome bd ubiquinol oxidase subunit I
MNDALLARTQMAYSLGFHILFAAAGMIMPVLMVLAQSKWLRTRDPIYATLAKRWAKGTAVLFAIGAVSGTALSFELGLLFPAFMAKAGPLVGMPFSLEGFAFFTEAIFLGMYFYGADKLSERVHLWCGIVVAVSGTLSAVFVTFVNAWMNSPTGFSIVDGKLENIDPVAALSAPFAKHEIPHTVLAAAMATSLLVAGIHALGMLRGHQVAFHRAALKIALTIAIPSTLLQPIVGHFAGEQVAEMQPLKLAAMEGLQHTQSHAPLAIGPVEIPGLLSLMSFGDTNAVVQGLDAFPVEDHPPKIVRFAHLTMIGLGMTAAAYAAFTLLVLLRRRRLPEQRWWLKATILLAPAGMVAMEAGWIVTEVGRQPWIIYGVLRTKDAVTPVTGLILPFVLFAVLYAVLGFVVARMLWTQIATTQHAELPLPSAEPPQ